MPNTVEHILDAALTLSEVEKSELAVRLLEKLEPETWPPDDWDRELQRRVEDIRAGRAVMIEWDQARRELWNVVNAARVIETILP